MKEIAKNQEVVAIVRGRFQYGCNKLYYGDFNSPHIAMMLPAIKQEDGTFKDLRSGAQIELGKDDHVWKLFSGSVLEYPDGEQILISRKCNPERTYITLSSKENEFEYRETSMTLKKVVYYKAPEKKPWER